MATFIELPDNATGKIFRLCDCIVNENYQKPYIYIYVCVSATVKPYFSEKPYMYQQQPKD